MATEAALAMKTVVAQVHPVLKAAGFGKRSHTFNRIAEPGVVQVVNFQMGPFDPPGASEIPGLRPNLYGHFAVNLGVYVEEAWRLEHGRFGSDGAAPKKDWVNEYDCQLRRRSDDFESETGWWSLTDSGVGAAIVERLEVDAFVWFDRFANRLRILAELECVPIHSYELSGYSPDRMLAVRMRLGAGDRQGAQKCLDEWVAHCRARVDAEPHLNGHLEHLAEFAVRGGLVMPSPDRTQ